MNTIDVRVPTTTRSSLMRCAAVAGIAGPVLFALTLLTLQQLKQGDHDPVRDVVSALEAGELGWVQQASFVVLGMLTMVFAVGLHRGIAPSRFGVVGPAALFLSGVANVLVGAFLPLREDASGAVYDPGGHQVVGTIFFASSFVALIALSRRCGRDPRWRGLAGWVLAAGVLAAVSFPVMGALVIPDGAPLHDCAGLAQRIVVLVLLFPARVALAVRLLRISA